jgi:tetratricopeptide (TPR) repeat protein
MKSCILMLVLLVLSAVAQQPKNLTFNVGTPEGQLLQQIALEQDDAKKQMLMEEFLDKYPKHEGAGWVCAMLEAAYNQEKQYDKSLEIAEKVYPNVPDMDAAWAALKAAEAKEDIDLVKKWSGRTSESARKVVASMKAPANDDDKQQLKYAKDVDAYSEYALYMLATKVKEPAQVIDLVETLEHQNRKSQYLPLVTRTYLNAEGGKACATAERLAAGDAKNPPAMLVAADCSWRAQHADKVVSYATKALAAISTLPKNEGGSDAAEIGTANFYIGAGYTLQGRFGPANKALRAALPAIKGDEQLYAFALFDLGLANYSLGKAVGDKAQMREGLKFFEESAGMKSSVQDQAARNASLVRTELGGK